MRQQRTAAIVGGSIAFLAILVVVGLAVRGQPVSCAASLSVPSVSIVVSGKTTSVSAVEVCAATACSFDGGPTASPTPDPSANLPGEPVTGEPVPVPTAPVFARQTDANHWFVVFVSSRPAAARVVVRGEGGRILVSKSFTLRWHQVGATSVCGNSHTTPPLHLTLPAT